MSLHFFISGLSALLVSLVTWRPHDTGFTSCHTKRRTSPWRASSSKGTLIRRGTRVGGLMLHFQNHLSSHLLARVLLFSTVLSGCGPLGTPLRPRGPTLSPGTPGAETSHKPEGTPE